MNPAMVALSAVNVNNFAYTASAQMAKYAAGTNREALGKGNANHTPDILTISGEGFAAYEKMRVANAQIHESQQLIDLANSNRKQ